VYRGPFAARLWIYSVVGRRGEKNLSHKNRGVLRRKLNVKLDSEVTPIAIKKTTGKGGGGLEKDILKKVEAGRPTRRVPGGG